MRKNLLNLDQYKINNSELIQNINKIKKLEWKQGLYEKQSWGHPLHRIGPYVGRIKPAFAHFLIKYLTKEGQTILDPFCGIGTICLEGSLMKRNFYGYDLNPYAIHIAEAKIYKKINLEKIISEIKKTKINTKKINLRNIPKWVKNYYNSKTLKEILFFLDHFKKKRSKFLYGCLLAISQGHRPGHLSKPCAWTLPYKPRPDDPGEYRSVKPRLISKILRNYRDIKEPQGKMVIKKIDARKLPNKNQSIDAIITSPPYLNTLDYVNSHRLRLAICGHYEKNNLSKLKNKLIQNKKNYLSEMEKVIREIFRVLKNGGICCFVVGDHFEDNGKVINTSRLLLNIFKRYNFDFLDIIEDKIPVNKSVQKKTLKIKSDRIFVLKKNAQY
jgi:DNA modification methylase|tara:strand:+ start:638 stop:1792 length:1155 start_codon:yes stop_codon:yes gene_type:complete